MLLADSQTQCHRHPHLPVTGFCASCLRERLAGLEEEEGETTTTTHTSTTTRNFIKSIFSRHITDPNPSLLPSSSSLFPGLRRCQSFSVAGRVAITSPFLPHRRSCDVVRPRNTLSSLFHLHNDQSGGLHHVSHTPKADDLPPNVAPLHENQRHGDDNDEVFQDVVIEDDDQKDKTVPVVIEDKVIGGLQKEKENMMTIGGEEREKKEPAKATKQPKDLKEIAGSFWTAASLFSKKLQKWRRKQKMKRQQQPREGIILGEMRGVQEEEEKKKKNGFYYASSDVFGGRRRSCDIDTRFCLDGGRTSLDESRVSWDEGRASWDGYLIGGGRSIFSTRLPQSTVEEDTIDKVPRSDGLIPVEEDMDRFLPGGTAQTRDYYYLDPSQRRRRSIDRSMNVDETKVVSVAAAAAEVSIGNGGSSVGVPKLKRDSNSFRRRDSTDSVDDVIQNKSQKWSKAWNIWGFINRKTSSIPRTAGVGNAMKGTTPLELRRRYRDIDSENRRVCRSHSGRWSSSSRYYSTIDNCGPNSCGGGYGSARKSSLEVNGHAMKKREEFVTCGRRRYLAAASSPGRNSNSRRHGGGGAGNDSHHRYNNNTNSFARSMMQFY